MVGEGRALQGANFCFVSSSYIQGYQFHADAQESNNEFSFFYRRCIVLYIDNTKIGFCYLAMLV